MNRKNKVIVFGSTATLALPMAFSAPIIGWEPAPMPDVRIVATFTKMGRALPPAEPQTAFVGEKIADACAATIPPTGIDYESPKPSGSSAISTPKEVPRDKPSPASTPSQNTASLTATKPKMGDTRTVNGEKQIYILGFGWIEDNDEPISVL